MPHETVLKLDPLPETLYALHQQVWQLMAFSSDQERDFLYAVDRDHGELYVRADAPRAELGPWRPLAPLAEGRRYAAVGTLALDSTRSRVRGQEAFGWCHPLVLERRIRPMFERFMQLDALSISLGYAEPFSKDERAKIFWKPVHVRAEGTVIDAAKANAVMQHGMGRARAFGFGVLHFLPASA